MSTPKFLLPPLSLILALLVACGGGEESPAHEPAAAPAGAAGPETPPETNEAEAASPEGGEEVDVGPDGGGLDIAVTYANTCASCHGAEGAGDGPAGTVLATPPANFADPAFWAERDDDTVARSIKEGAAATGGSPQMAAFGAQFDDSQISALVAHLKTFSE